MIRGAVAGALGHLHDDAGQIAAERLLHAGIGRWPGLTFTASSTPSGTSWRLLKARRRQAASRSAPHPDACAAANTSSAAAYPRQGKRANASAATSRPVETSTIGCNSICKESNGTGFCGADDRALRGRRRRYMRAPLSEPSVPPVKIDSPLA